MFRMENETFGRSNHRRAAPAVAKAVRVLDAVADLPVAPRMSDIARRAGLGKSTVHGLVGALVDEGLLARTVDGARFLLGPRLVELGNRSRDQRLLDAADDELACLTREIGETSLFGRVEETRVRILARRESARSLSLSAPIGSSVPLLAGALGKAFLATLDAEDADAYLRSRTLPLFTERAIVDPERYLDAVQSARARGFSAERSEYLPGIAAVASAFCWMGSSYLVWAVSIDSVHDDAGLKQIGVAVHRTARSLQRRLSADRERTRERSA